MLKVCVMLHTTLCTILFLARFQGQGELQRAYFQIDSGEEDDMVYCLLEELINLNTN